MKSVITTTKIETPLGPMLAGAIKEGICFLEFVDRQRIDKALEKLQKLLDADVVEGSNHNLQALSMQLDEYFKGVRESFNVPLAVFGTPFQTKVWESLQSIPYGQTISYQEQSRRIGYPNAVRAVGRANGANRIAILIPCHRVIGKTGKLIGYGAGLWRKEWLLAMEGRHQPEKD